MIAKNIWCTLGLVAILTASAMAYRSEEGWAELPRQRQAMVYVGDPDPNAYKCCTLGAYTSCFGKCVATPIFCNPGAVVSGQCATATCSAVQNANSVCNLPNNIVTTNIGQCTLTGETISTNCADPQNTGYCDANVSTAQNNTTTCNNGDSLCADQPFFSCPW